MDIKTEPVTKPSHGFALLKELDMQRRTGTFCDCVIRLRVRPEQLFVAHKSVLAAFSPVFATLLPQHGSFMDLNAPLLTPETLALLLEYMYTGTLPPKSHEEPVLYAAFHLQMEQLLHELTCRRKDKEITHTVQDQTNRKRDFTKHESLDKTLLSSPSYLSRDADQPSTSSYEVVPVICHLKGMGNNKLQSHCLAKTLDVGDSGLVPEFNKHPQTSQDHNSFFESSQSKHDKNEMSVNFSSTVIAEEGEKCNSSCGIGQLQHSGSQMIAGLRSNIDNKDQNVHSAYTSSKHLSPKPECRKSAIRCVLGVDNIETLNPFESEKHTHVSGILSDTLSDQKSQNATDDNSENRSRAFGQIVTEHRKCFCEDNSADADDTTCEKSTSDLNTWHKSDAYSDSSSESSPVEKVSLGVESQKSTHSDCCEFSRLRKDCTDVYQGHLRYHCLPGSNDSDSDGTCPRSNVNIKDCSKVLETLDMAEVLLSTRERLMSVSHKHTKTRRFQCSVPECEKAFSQRGSLNRHMRSHLGIRPYSCPFCTMTFSRQYRVTEHLRVHQRCCNDPP